LSMVEPHDIIARMHITDTADRVTIVRIPIRVPTESNFVYKKRLITAMLEEPVFSEISRPAPKFIPGWSPKVVAAAVGIALFSGLGVFLFLYHHDASAGSSAAATALGDVRGPGMSSTHENVAVSQQDTGDRVKLAVLPANPAASIDHDVSRLTPLEFKLKRSRTYQKIGTLGLRLVRVNPRRRTCDLSIQLSDRRVVQRRLLLNKPLQLKPPTSSEPLQLSILGIGRDSVAGALSVLPPSSDAPTQ
jgi:hypothetical protein